MRPKCYLLLRAHAKGSLCFLTKAFLLSLSKNQFTYPLSQRPHPMSLSRYQSSIIHNQTSSLISCPSKPEILKRKSMPKHPPQPEILLIMKSSPTEQPSQPHALSTPHHLNPQRIPCLLYKICMPFLNKGGTDNKPDDIWGGRTYYT